MPTLYVDMDGTLSDFAGGVFRRFERPNLYRQASGPRGRAAYNTAACMGLTEAEFWAGIDDYEFWSGLDPTPEAPAIVELSLEYLPVEGIWLLTSLSQGEECKRGKRDWMARHFPQFAERIIYSRTKGDFADRASILLDDGQQNVDAFRAAGGIAWLVPRPWNDDHEREPFLSEDLAAFLAETLPALRCRAA